ncbi:hypothetical protein KP806_13295 [Paenibacillus sp. N4]|nr:hypothetical protein [Paenibacillus vietnamensis]MCA0756026.1 hypothetical protein [Paenibacillus vietnamensis]
MDKELSETTNSMAPTEQDIVKLGKDMERMETNSEIARSGMVPDPKQ